MSDASWVLVATLFAIAGWFGGGSIQHSEDASDLHDAKVVHQRDVILRDADQRTNLSQRALIDLLLKRLEAARVR